MARPAPAAVPPGPKPSPPAAEPCRDDVRTAASAEGSRAWPSDEPFDSRPCSAPLGPSPVRLLSTLPAAGSAARWCATAAVCHHPHAAPLTHTCASACTLRGAKHGAASPCPSRPNIPSPHVKSAPSHVMAAVWYGPHETCETLSPASASVRTSLGCVTGTEAKPSPCPSCPAALLPQV